MWKQAGNFGIGEGLNKAETDRNYPHHPGWFADRSGNRAHRKQYQSRNTAGYPEGTRPVDAAMPGKRITLDLAVEIILIFDSGVFLHPYYPKWTTVTEKLPPYPFTPA